MATIQGNLDGTGMKVGIVVLQRLHHEQTA
jgi:hypothetical protein